MVHGQNTNGTWAMYELYMMIIPNENRAQSNYLQTKRGRIFLTRPQLLGIIQNFSYQKSQ